MKLVVGGFRGLALAFYLAAALLPLYWIVKMAFTPTAEVLSGALRLWPSALTLEHFQQVLNDAVFRRYFVNSVVVALSTSVLATLIASLTGAGLSRLSFRGKGLVSFVLLLTQFFPIIIVIVPLYRMLTALHLNNNLLGLVIVYTALNIPFATFLMKSFFDAVPRDLDEAGYIDGCTRFGALRRIVAPLTLPGMGATLGFVFTAAWSELLFALVLIDSESQKTLSVGMLNFIQKGGVDWGQITAAATLALIPAILFFAMIQKYLVQGLTSGSVKG